MSTAALLNGPRLDVDGFLAFLDRNPGEKWELHEGVPRALTGGTYAHATIASNIVAALTPQARDRGCSALGGFLVDIGDESAYEPDALVVCSPVSNAARSTDRPVIVFEVLSPSTMNFDRAGKAANYRSLSSLQQLVFVYQDSVRVESWRRQDEGWITEPDVLLSRERSLTLPAIAGSIALADIYAGVVPSPRLD